MKLETRFVCTQCGNISPRWLGKCPECGAWNSYEEEIVTSKKDSLKPRLSLETKAIALKDVSTRNEARLLTGIRELDTVLGGGIVEGSLILVGGDPGIGKSTLLLQMAANLSVQGKRVLYVSGEESLVQIRLRSKRLITSADTVELLSETRFEIISGLVTNNPPDILIVDSIQTMSISELQSAPGSVTQIREVTAELMKLAKSQGVATFIVGHMTKAGNIAGPKLLEHIVDTVLYFEGEGSELHRILRSVKNRFGSTNEVGLFAMTSSGLEEVTNPSKFFLSEHDARESGTVIYPSIEGSRPLMVELQSLVTPSNYANPRRMSAGLDYNRLVMALAILEKKRGLMFYDQDVYVNAVGGISLSEPALMLPMMVSVASSLLNIPVPQKTVILGEVGLLGEIRPVPQVEKRLLEARRLGYERAIIPKTAGLQLSGMEVIQVRELSKVFEVLFAR